MPEALFYVFFHSLSRSRFHTCRCWFVPIVWLRRFHCSPLFCSILKSEWGKSPMISTDWFRSSLAIDKGKRQLFHSVVGIFHFVIILMCARLPSDISLLIRNINFRFHNWTSYWRGWPSAFAVYRLGLMSLGIERRHLSARFIAENVRNANVDIKNAPFHHVNRDDINKWGKWKCVQFLLQCCSMAKHQEREYLPHKNQPRVWYDFPTPGTATAFSACAMIQFVTFSEFPFWAGWRSN